MKKIIEANTVAVAATNAVAKVNPMPPSGLNHMNHPTLNMVGKDLGSTNDPMMCKFKTSTLSHHMACLPTIHHPMWHTLITTTQTHGSSPLATVPQTLIISYPYGMPSHFGINHSLTLPFPNVPSMFPTGSISFSTSQPHSPHTSSSLTHTRPPFPYPIFTTITTPNMTPSIPHFSFSFFITQP